MVDCTKFSVTRGPRGLESHQNFQCRNLFLH
ncbi:unnamed protein product [Spirodela intermedia]|uniref:Uncharacterized protein n=1 Tax=Spirodela intermedia TaxID=51605 RepID=A0A7I8KYB0_SPIIN|nr:unnamed protein product [Spirodela intermedia]